MSRIFLSHASSDSRKAIALKQWLGQQNPRLANEIFLDLDPASGIRTGERWKDALQRANARCEAVVCLLSEAWESSSECEVEYRFAETLNKRVFSARLEPDTGAKTSAWQWCDLFGDGPTIEIDIGDGEPVRFASEGLYRLRDGIRGAGIGADSFVWPVDEPDRSPYRGWQSFEPDDAGIFFGRDAQIVRALDAIRGMRKTKNKRWFVILGPSGSGKSSFLRAGLVPRLLRDDREFLVLGIMRPERDVLDGANGFAASIFAARRDNGLSDPPLGDIRAMCDEGPAPIRRLLVELQEIAQSRLLERGQDTTRPTLVLPLDQAEEVLSGEGRDQADRFLRLVSDLVVPSGDDGLDMIVAATIRSDRFESLQIRAELADVATELFGELKPMPTQQFKEIITGPAHRVAEAGRPLQLEPALVDRLLNDCKEGSDTLPLLSLTLSRLYENYASTQTLTLAQYDKMGGLRQVVQTEIDGILSRDPHQRQRELACLRSAFIPWLATINPDNDQAMRKVARWNDLPAESHPLLDKFVARRLMVLNTGGERGTVVEVALESLFRQWDDLKEWLEEERENLKRVETLERSATDWRKNNRDPAWLIGATRLEDAELLAQRAGFQQRLAVIADYLGASRQAENAEIEEKERVRKAELQAERDRALAAQERAQHAHELAAQANAREAETAAYANILRRRTRILRVVVAVTAVVAVIAAIGVVGFARANNMADKRFRDATSLKLVAQGLGILANTTPGNDVQAIQQVLAAKHISDNFDDGVLYSAAVQKANSIKIIQASKEVSSISYSPALQRIAYGSTDDNVYLADAVTGLPVGKPLVGHKGGVFAVEFSPDGLRLASGDEDGTVRLWNAQTGEAIGEPIQAGTRLIRSLAFNPNGDQLVIGSEDGNVRICDLGGRTFAGTINGDGKKIGEIAFSADGGFIASGYVDGTVRLWDAHTFAQIGAPIEAKGKVLGMAISPNGRLIATGSSNKQVRIWDVGTHQQLGDPLDAPDGALDLAFTGDSRRLVAGLGNGDIQIWDAETRQLLGDPLTGHQGPVDAVAVDPTGSRVFSGSRDGTVRVWDPNLGQPMIGHTGEVLAVAFRRGGHRIASASFDSTLRIWERETGQPVGQPLKDNDDKLMNVAFSDDGYLLVSASDDGKVRIWDPGTGTLRHRIQVWENESQALPTIPALAFRPGGYMLAAGGYEHTVKLFDAETGKQVGEPLRGPDDAEWWSLAFSPDGKTLVGGTIDGKIQFWDVENHKPLGKPLTDHSLSVESLAFSPDGHVLASASRDETIRLWDPESRKPLGDPLEGNHGMVFGIAFSPDGRQLASANADNTIQMWDVASRKPFGDPLRGHTNWVRSVAFSSDGQRLVSGSFDQTVRLWPARASDEDLCGKLTSNMSHKQWDEMVSPDIDYIKVCDDLPIAPD